MSGESRHKGYHCGARNVLHMDCGDSCPPQSIHYTSVHFTFRMGEFDGMQTIPHFSQEKRRQQILKAGKGTPIVGKACLEGKELMEGGEVMETGFDRPVQGIDSAGIKDELYRAEEKPN